jgi:uncharacterized membrane protein SpoIIM required for sporulation
MASGGFPGSIIMKSGDMNPSAEDPSRGGIQLVVLGIVIISLGLGFLGGYTMEIPVTHHDGQSLISIANHNIAVGLAMAILGWIGFGVLGFGLGICGLFVNGFVLGASTAAFGFELTFSRMPHLIPEVLAIWIFISAGLAPWENILPLKWKKLSSSKEQAAVHASLFIGIAVLLMVLAAPLEVWGNT